MNTSQKTALKLDEKKHTNLEILALFGLVLVCSFMVFNVTLNNISTSVWYVFFYIYSSLCLAWLFGTMKIIAPAYGVYISQLTWYARACDSYPDLFEKGVAAKKETTEPMVPSG